MSIGSIPGELDLARLRRHCQESLHELGLAGGRTRFGALPAHSPDVNNLLCESLDILSRD